MSEKQSFSIGEWLLFLLLIAALVLPRDWSTPSPNPQVNVEQSYSPEYGMHGEKGSTEREEKESK